MSALAVDDEVLMLGALVSAIKASPDITEVAKFFNGEEAMKYVKDNPVDIVFGVDRNGAGVTVVEL